MQKSYVTYTVPFTSSASQTVTTLESRAILASSGTTGLRTWEAALHLATYLCSDNGRMLIQGKSIIELGAGTGFLSILCAKHLGANYVLATDGSGDVIDALGSNIYLNGLESSGVIGGAVLIWGHTLIDGVLNVREDHENYDVVLGADLVGTYPLEHFNLVISAEIFQIYDHRAILPLVATLQELFEKYQGIIAILSATVRNEKTFQAFKIACSAYHRSHPMKTCSHLRSDAKAFHLNTITMTPDTSSTPQTGFFHSTAIPITIFTVRKGSY